MSSELIPFQFNAHDIRVRLDDTDTPWWIATDVGAVLGHTNISVMMRRLDEDEKTLNSIYPGGPEAWFVNEFGLYKLLLGSRKPEAKAFQRWVTHEILPQIRKTGKYTPTTPQVKNPVHQLLIDTVVRLDQVEQEAAEAKVEAAQANALRAIETQLFFTVAEYVCFEQLQAKVPESAYRALSDHLRLYCMDNRVPFRRIPIGGQRWNEEYAFHISVWTDVFPAWLARRYSQTELHVIRNTGD